MKNKVKVITFAALATSFVATAQAQDLVAGWDFSQFFGGANSVTGSDFVGAGNVEANYSDFFSPSPDIGAAALGSIYYEGSFGSTNTNPGNFGAPVQPATGNLTSVNLQTADGNPFNDQGSYNLLTASGQGFTNDLQLGVNGAFDIVFEADLTSLGLLGDDWTLTFAGLGDGASASWSVSTDGSDYTSLNQTTSFTNLDSSYQVNVGALQSDKIYLLGSFTGNSLIDNVGISALTSPIPEPSTYAAIAGALALAFVAYRRRA